VFVHLAITGESDDQPLNNLLTKLETFGHPVLRIKLESREHIVQEFFRWEFATAVAGAIMGINPFDQPDVESAKIAARKITDKYETSGKLDLPKPIISDSGISLFTDQANRDAINSDMTRDETGSANPTVYDWIRSHLKRADAGDYIAILAYLEMNEVNLKALEGLRQAIVRLTHRPVTLGFGPRFLHSTGQAHKGGPNSGVFLQITADDQDDLEIPNRKFTFSVVKNAQALGDFNVLLERKRRAIHLKIENPTEKQLFKIAESLK
jgi:transaldolase/glucose-6-phosphate isomerase